MVSLQKSSNAVAATSPAHCFSCSEKACTHLPSKGTPFGLDLATATMTEHNSGTARIILALDIGSSSIRCSAYGCSQSQDGTGHHVTMLPDCSSHIAYSAIEPNTGKIRIFETTDGNNNGTGDGSIFDLVDQCVDDAIQRLRKSFTNDSNHNDAAFVIEAVGFSCFVMNLIGLDDRGHPVGNEATISYACNTPQVARACAGIQADLYCSTGAPIHSAYAIPQLRELSAGHVHRWQSIPGVCLSRWTAMRDVPLSFSEASWTGLLNVHTCQYDVQALALLPAACRAALPSLKDFDEFDGKVGSGSANADFNEYAKRWPELQSSKLFLGLGDGACANIGSKCCTSSRIAVTIGTSAASRICLRYPIQPNAPTPAGDEDEGDSPPQLLQAPKGLFMYRINRHHILIGGALTDGGSVFEWATKFLNLTTKEAIGRCMEDVEAIARSERQKGSNHAGRLTMIPFLSGERSTGYRTGASGAVVGLTRQTTAAQFVKSCLDGVTLRIQAIVQLILQSRADEDRPTVLVSGKALESNAYWRQSLADALGLQVVMDSDTNEGTSRGVARLVAMSLSSAQNDEAMSLSEEPIHADVTCMPNVSTYFDTCAIEQEGLLDALTPLYNSM